jgi:hypothetical protein
MNNLQYEDSTPLTDDQQITTSVAEKAPLKKKNHSTDTSNHANFNCPATAKKRNNISLPNLVANKN